VSNLHRKRNGNFFCFQSFQRIFYPDLFREELGFGEGSAAGRKGEKQDLLRKIILVKPIDFSAEWLIIPDEQHKAGRKGPRRKMRACWRVPE
jgi:hypothetical protein